MRRMDDEEYKACVYEAMRYIFDVQRDLGRLFHEKIYQREAAFRIPGAQREVSIEARFEGFCKLYYLDLLVGGGAIFEMKAAESLSERHRRQLLHYLFLTGLPHGKLVNLRPERVGHEFVNNCLSLSDRTSFQVSGDGWEELETTRLQEGMTAALRDWGTGLDLRLYEEVALHLCGQPPDAETDVAIRLNGHFLGPQRMPLAAPGVALRITALPAKQHARYRADLQQFLDHTDLRAVQWINITRPIVEFTSVRRAG